MKLREESMTFLIAVLDYYEQHQMVLLPFGESYVPAITPLKLMACPCVDHRTKLFVGIRISLPIRPFPEAVIILGRQCIDRADGMKTQIALKINPRPMLYNLF
jgi:hypothetical protein